jgi:hypothetical protein
LSAPPHGRPPSQYSTPRGQLACSTARSTAQSALHTALPTLLLDSTVDRPDNNPYCTVNSSARPHGLPPSQ